jgi:hypothetical protein
MILLNQNLLLTNPTHAKLNKMKAHSSGIPKYIISLIYCGNRAKVNVPQNNPFNVLVVIAAVNASVALPCCANGYPSTIVAAAELAPGIPNSIPAYVSPVVLEATTAIQKITPR